MADANIKLKDMLDSLTIKEYDSLWGGVQQAFDELKDRIEEYELTVARTANAPNRR